MMPTDMKPEDEFADLLRLQGNLELVSKEAMLRSVREHGVEISERQLTTFVTAGLVPKSARMGSKSGVYPAIVVELLTWIGEARERNLSFEAIRALIPIWKAVKAATASGELDLAMIEQLAVPGHLPIEAAYALPGVLQAALPCPSCETDKLRLLTLVGTDGVRHIVADKDTISIGFAIFRPHVDGPDECADVIARRSITLLPPDPLSPLTVRLFPEHSGPRVDGSDAHGDKVKPARSRSGERPIAVGIGGDA